MQDTCRTRLASLDRFENYVNTCLVARLAHRLVVLTWWVGWKAELLSREHKGEGYVCLFLSEKEGLFAYWVEKPELVANKAGFQASGYTVLSQTEFIDIVMAMNQEWSSGNWANVVDWMNRYGKSPGLDFNRFP